MVKERVRERQSQHINYRLFCEEDNRDESRATDLAIREMMVCSALKLSADINCTIILGLFFNVT